MIAVAFDMTFVVTFATRLRRTSWDTPTFPHVPMRVTWNQCCLTLPSVLEQFESSLEEVSVQMRLQIRLQRQLQCIAVKFAVTFAVTFAKRLWVRSLLAVTFALMFAATFVMTFAAMFAAKLRIAS